jgi:hypothetical protein
MQADEPALGGQHRRKRQPAPEKERECERSTEQGSVDAVGEERFRPEPKTCGGEQLGVPTADPPKREKGESRDKRRRRKGEWSRCQTATPSARRNASTTSPPQAMIRIKLKTLYWDMSASWSSCSVQSYPHRLFVVARFFASGRPTRRRSQKRRRGPHETGDAIPAKARLDNVSLGARALSQSAWAGYGLAPV